MSLKFNSTRRTVYVSESGLYPSIQGPASYGAPDLQSASPEYKANCNCSAYFEVSLFLKPAAPSCSGRLASGIPRGHPENIFDISGAKGKIINIKNMLSKYSQLYK
jgi:hypothetical protein